MKCKLQCKYEGSAGKVYWISCKEFPVLEAGRECVSVSLFLFSAMPEAKQMPFYTLQDFEYTVTFTPDSITDTVL